MKKFWFLIIPVFVACQSTGDKSTDPSEFATLNESELVQKMNELNRAIRKNVNDEDLYLERSLVFQAGGDIQSAMADIDRGLKVNPNNAELYVRQGELFVLFNDYRQAENAFKKASSLDKDNVNSRLKLAEFYFYSQRFSEGMKLANEVLRIDKYNAEAYFLKGLIHERSGDTTMAISSYQTCVEQNPDYFEAYFQLGMLHSFLLDPLAIEYYNNAIRIKPQEVQSYYNKGLICQQLGEYNQALSAYSDLLNLDPNYKDAHFNMGYVNMFYLKQYQQGAVHFSRAIEVSPDFYQAYYNRGYCYELMGDIIRANVDYKNALHLKPDYTLAAEGMSRVTIN